MNVQPDISVLPALRDWAHPALDRFEGAGLLVRDASVGQAAERVRGQLAHLSAPWPQDADGLALAGARAARWVGQLAGAGALAIAPVIQAAAMIRFDVEMSFDVTDELFWLGWSVPLHHAANAVIVPPMPGAMASDWVWADIRSALMTNRTVFLLRHGGGPW